MSYIRDFFFPDLVGVVHAASAIWQASYAQIVSAIQTLHPPWKKKKINNYPKPENNCPPCEKKKFLFSRG